VTRFYAVLESKEFEQLEDGFTDITLSQNMLVTKLPVRSTPAFLTNLDTAWVNGTTLWLDYSFPAFPENLGHWMEMLLPVYSQLSVGKWKEQLRPGEDPYVGACIFPNLRRGQVQVRLGALQALCSVDVMVSSVQSSGAYTSESSRVMCCTRIDLAVWPVSMCRQAARQVLAC